MYQQQMKGKNTLQTNLAIIEKLLMLEHQYWLRMFKKLVKLYWLVLRMEAI